MSAAVAENEATVTATATVVSTKETTVLGLGMKGEPVLGLQQALKSLGFDPGAIDSVYSPATEAAVRAFQEREDLEVTGIFDEATRKAFASSLAVHSIARRTALTLVPPGTHPRNVVAAAEAGAAAGATKVIKGTVVQEGVPSGTPFWRESWFLLVASGAAAVATAFLLRRKFADGGDERDELFMSVPLAKPTRTRRPKLSGAFDDFEDRDAVAELAAVLEDGEDEIEDEDPEDDDAPASPPAPKRQKKSKAKKPATAAA